MIFIFSITVSTTHLSSHLGTAKGDELELDHDKVVVIYNRVPKTGSTSFIGLAYDLCFTNHFNVIHINTSHNSPTLSLADQVRLFIIH